MLMPLLGRPMLLTTLCTRSCGSSARIFASTRLVSAVVSSMRRPVGPPDVDAQRVGLDGGEEVAAEIGREHEGRQDRREESADEHAAVAQRQRQQPEIEEPQPLEAALERPLHPHEDRGPPAGIGVRVVLVPLEEEPRHRRHHRIGEDVRGDHREHDGFRQRPEQVAGDARRAPAAARRRCRMQNSAIVAGGMISCAPLVMGR